MVLFEEINRQLEYHGLKIKKAEAALVDATIITSAARLRRTEETYAKEVKQRGREFKELYFNQ